jgi:hypothetical protein
MSVYRTITIFLALFIALTSSTRLLVKQPDKCEQIDIDWCKGNVPLGETFKKCKKDVAGQRDCGWAKI